MSTTFPIGEPICPHCGQYTYTGHVCNYFYQTDSTFTFTNNFKMHIRKLDGKWQFTCDCMPNVVTSANDFADIEDAAKKHFHKYFSAQWVNG